MCFHDTYTTYAVSSTAAWVTLLSPNEVQNLAKELRLELLHQQAKLGRGQISNFDEYSHLLRDHELEQALNNTFNYDGKKMLELSYDLWRSFTFETQKRWLEKFISEDRSKCLSSTLSKSQWRHINKYFPSVKHLIGFSDKSGPNCFATTLAARLEVKEARKVSGLWLQSETFLREIENRGYQKSGLQATEHLPDGSILIWQNNSSIQHACFYLGDELVFNKDAQSWFAPRQILRLKTALANWSEDNLEVQVYTL